ncbi:MAG: molybdopterin-dependent oxidoreductase [Planctomycetes bacterium]|nr:molybdopterin-dependent oxidoreductase [Planctomycetota bacterium]
MPQTPSTCPLDCPDACGIAVETDDAGRFVRLKGNPDHGWSRGVLCAKTSMYGEVIASPTRLTTPLVRDERDELVPASWDQALARIVERMRGVKGERVLAAWYAGNMGMVSRRFPLRAMHALGATFVDGGLCDNTATAGYECVLGAVIGPDLDSIVDADCVVLWGADVARTVQHLQPKLLKLAKAGVPIVAIDLYRTETIQALEKWGGKGFTIAPGSDAALALVLARLAFERGRADRAFLERECLGASEFEAHVRSTLDVADAARATGLEASAIEELARLLFAAQRPLLKTGVGWTRRRHGAMSMRAVCSLAAVLGVADRVHYESFASFGLAEDALERPDLRPNDSPAKLVRHVALGEELESGRYDAVFVWGHNPAVTCPDSSRVRRGLERDDVFVVVHEQFLTETAERADVVLPAATFVEVTDVFRSYGHRYMQFSRKACRAPGAARGNVQAFAAVARALGLRRETWDVTEESLCEELLAASSSRLSPADVERIRTGRPFKITPPTRAALGGWGTPSGNIELVSASAHAAGQPALATYVADRTDRERGAFWLVAAPSRYTHNSTFSHSPRHVALNGKPRLFLHPLDAASRNLRDGEFVRVSNARGALSLVLACTADMPRGLARVDGMPRSADVPEGVGINALVSPDVSDLGDGNVLYSTRVDVERAT